jgi:hypothetical protein
MSKGGGSSSTQRQTSTSEPWKEAQPYLTDIMSRGQALSRQGASYYPNQTYVGPTAAEGAAWQQQANYNNAVFGNQPTLQYGNLSNYGNNAIQGNNQLGQMTGQMAPGAMGAVNSAFSPYDIGGRFDSLQGPQGSVREASPQAGQIGQYGFGTTLDAAGNAPQYGQAGNLDATGAYQRMLSGQPDYQGTQGAIDAANAQVMRQLTDKIVPQLNQQATFSNNMTGGIKGLNAAMPEIAQRMSENAQNINNQERIRALEQQERAANSVSQGGLQSYGLGLQTAQGQRGLEQSQANLNLSADQARANMGLSDAQLGLQTDMARYGINSDAANFGLQREQARESAMGGYRSDALGYGNLAGNLAAQSAGDQARAAAMFPGIYDMGRTPSTDSLAYANYDRAIQEDALQSDIDRFNYMRDQPYNNLGWYSNLVTGAASPYGTQSSTTTGPAGSRAAGALGGAMAGSQIGGMFGNPATGGYSGWGAILGGLAGMYL